MKKTFIQLALTISPGLVILFVVLYFKPQDLLPQQVKDFAYKALDIIAMLPIYAILLLVAVGTIGAIWLILAALAEK